jgi:hypothetical protein
VGAGRGSVRIPAITRRGARNGVSRQCVPQRSCGTNRIYDDSTNTVFVQAAPGDMAEIEDLIWRLDNTVSLALNDLRIIPLKNVPSDELSAVLQQALTEGLVAGSPPAAPAAPGAPGAIRPPGAGPTPAGTTPSGVTTRTTSLRFISGQRGVPAMVAGMLEDVHVTSDPRINALIVSAPEKSMDLIVSLIHELDVLPALHAEVSIFTLKRADATAMANLLQQLFLGTPGGAAVAPVAGPAPAIGPAIGAPGAPGGLGVAPALRSPRSITSNPISWSVNRFPMWREPPSTRWATSRPLSITGTLALCCR